MSRFVGSIAEIMEVRAREPKRIGALVSTRRCRDMYGEDGKLMVVACDHPARSALGAQGNPMAMASRAELQEALDAHGLTVLAGTVFSHLHQPGAWDYTWKQVTDVAALTKAVGGEHIVVIPEPWRNHKTGAAQESPDLSSEQWDLLTTQTDELGRRILQEYGLHVQFHSHADTHVGYQPEIERFLQATNPEYVNLCLDTGHVAYYGGDCLELIAKYPDRIGYVHLKQVNPEIIEKVLDKDLSFPEAVRMGAMIEPPLGVPAMGPLLDALSNLGRDLSGIIEHELYPCAPDVPLPIAKRTKTYLSSCSGADIDMGVVAA